MQPEILDEQFKRIINYNHPKMRLCELGIVGGNLFIFINVQLKHGMVYFIVFFSIFFIIWWHKTLRAYLKDIDINLDTIIFQFISNAVILIGGLSVLSAIIRLLKIIFDTLEGIITKAELGYGLLSLVVFFIFGISNLYYVSFIYSETEKLMEKKIVI